MTDVSPPTSATADPLHAGRDALIRHAWPEAFEQLSQADRAGPLSGADLEGLALAAFFAAHGDEEIGIKERAFKAYEAEGDELRAAYLALDVARNYGYAGNGGTCYGDSGGPNFLGTTDIIAATTITGDAICRSTNVVYRLDTAAAGTFLSTYVTLP